MDTINEPKYSVGQVVKFNNWTNGGEGEILEIERIYHRRFDMYTWGYLLDVDNGMTLKYTPEGYISEVISQPQV